MSCYKREIELNSDDGYPLNVDDNDSNYKNFYYDLDEHRIILKDEAMVNKRNESLNARVGDKEAKVLYDETSEKIYEYIFSCVNESDRQNNIDIIEYLMAKTEKGYKAIVKALIAMVMYALRSDGDEVGDNHSVNTKSGTYISDFDKIREKLQVSQHVHNILKNNNLIDGVEYSFRLNSDQKRNGY